MGKALLAKALLTLLRDAAGHIYLVHSVPIGVSMVLGIGNDIIEISRIDNAIKRYGQKFLDKIFTLREQEYCQRYSQPSRHFAGRFAAKEAVVKAIGVGFRDGVTWLDIEIINDHQGKPIPIISKDLYSRFQGQLAVSISHCKEFASAVAILWSSMD